MKRVRDTAGGATTISQEPSPAAERTGTTGSAAVVASSRAECWGVRRPPPSIPAVVAAASTSMHKKPEAAVRHHEVYRAEGASRGVEGVAAAVVGAEARSLEGVVANHDDGGIQQGSSGGGGGFDGDRVSMAPAEAEGRDSRVVMSSVVAATAATAQTATVRDGKEPQVSSSPPSYRKRKARGVADPDGHEDESKPTVRRAGDGGTPGSFGTAGARSSGGGDRCRGASDSCHSVAAAPVAALATPVPCPDDVAEVAEVAKVAEAASSKAPTSRVRSRTEQAGNGGALRCASLPPPSKKRKENSDNGRGSASVVSNSGGGRTRRSDDGADAI